jgi:hypothetical protein
MLPNKLKDVRGVVLACLGEEEAAALFLQFTNLQKYATDQCWWIMSSTLIRIRL